MTKHNKQQGLTLIELMVSLVIGMLLLMGTISMFMSNKRSYKFQEEMGRLQENARFAMDLLINDIRTAGYYGCNYDINETTNHLNLAALSDPTLLAVKTVDANQVLSADYSVEGSENAANWSPSGTTIPANIVAGTDAISLRYANTVNAVRLTNNIPTTGNLTVAANSGLVQWDIIALSDCKSTDIFQITNDPTAGTIQHAVGTGTPGNVAVSGVTSGELKYPYDDTASIYRFVVRRYYVGDGANGLGLYMADDSDPSPDQPIIEGVENMQVLYGEDTNGPDNAACRECPLYTPTTYVAANAVTNWANVVSVRIGLLVRTADANFTEEADTKTYNLLGTDLGPFNDNFNRRTFTTTILLRNRAY